MNSLRKHLLSEDKEQSTPHEGEIDIAASAAISYSSEQPDHPVDFIFDGSGGRGATRWIGSKPDTTDRIILEFDQAQSISRLIYEVEENEVERTQEVRIDVRLKGGEVYRTVLGQQYHFSPAGATYQRQDVQLALSAVTHLRFTIEPHQSGHGSSTLTRMQLFS